MSAPQEVQAGLDWSLVDKPLAAGQAAYLEFCKGCVLLSEQGTTQQAIAQHCGMSQSKIAQAIGIGKDQRIITNGNNLPRDEQAVYLLTTLDDIGFKKLARVDTTRAEIQAYKQAQRPKAEPESQPQPKQPESKPEPLPESQPQPEPFMGYGGTISQRWETWKEYGRKNFGGKEQRAILAHWERGKALLLTMFWKNVKEEAQKISSPETKVKMEESIRHYYEEIEKSRIAREGIKSQLSLEDYKFLLNAFHPDRAPSGYEEKYTKAFRILNSLKEFIK